MITTLTQRQPTSIFMFVKNVKKERQKYGRKPQKEKHLRKSATKKKKEKKTLLETPKNGEKKIQKKRWHIVDYGTLFIMEV